MKRFALPVCIAAALAASTVAPAYGEEKGWYIGTGIGYSRADISDNVVGTSMNTVAPGQPVTSITRNNDSLMYQLFLGYSFTSFLALEANAFRLGDFGYSATTASGTGVTADLGMWGGSLDLLGIIPLGKSWRVYGRIGAAFIQSSVDYSGGNTSEDDAWNVGWKAGAGVGYEFDSGVAFRAEYNYYNVDTTLGGKVNTQVFSATALYRFK